MRILNASDFHVDVNTAGYRRFDDVTGAVRDTMEAAIDQNCDYYLFTGDFCDPDGGGDSFGYARFLTESAIYLADCGVKSIWMAGNHDVVESGNGYTTLSPLAGLTGSNGYSKMITLVEAPTVLSLWEGSKFEPAGGKVSMICLPFTSHDRGYDPALTVRLLGASIKPLTVVVAGHLNIQGIEIGSETTDFPRGRDVFFPQEACAELAKKKEVLKVNGHYHKAQTFEGIHIPGSVARLTFGEEDHAPGYQVFDL